MQERPLRIQRRLKHSIAMKHFFDPFCRVTYAVQGWIDNGRLWTPGDIVSVDDDMLKIREDLLLSDVTYRISAAGSVTELKLVPPESFDLLAEMPKTKNSSGYWSDEHKALAK